ncbi:H-type small acid-soluble spore protein [Alicyclobacillus sp. SO9]|uniref:H-type small acid-soluble spore protein n=1 Tax=Alicyclobacillus sp. SO9 TaxID=2665646 RepID=UPI0018E8577D|nr:H-type small acid-soluble spore protein [Alicyclobacillus sp. SO9]QQE80601.1 H-type small acid-soluble spore protein [Alicyclobacillus sp. SO9]
MNQNRAEQIARSPIMANVTYKGQPIYIQHVEDSGHSARVYPLNNPKAEQNVALDDLYEG